ncbi:MAG: hypothetical protein RIR59_1268 [Pseudomonadota bacterium]|jgi:hypothetical protein
MGRPITLGLVVVGIVGLLFLFASLETDKPVRHIEKEIVFDADH